MIRPDMRSVAGGLLVLLLAGGTAAAKDFTAADFDNPKLGAAEFADGNAGGPDEWEVVRLRKGETLKVRAAPNTKARVLATFAGGSRLKNHGCKTLGGTRWCKVSRASTINDIPVPLEAHGEIVGFARGQFLREAVGPAPAAPNVPPLAPVEPPPPPPAAAPAVPPPEAPKPAAEAPAPQEAPKPAEPAAPAEAPRPTAADEAPKAETPKAEAPASEAPAAPAQDAEKDAAPGK